MVKRLIDADRYAFVLLKEAIHEIDESEARGAWAVLRRQMALVPFGSVPIMLGDCDFVATEIGAFLPGSICGHQPAVPKIHRRRWLTTQLEIWPAKIWPSVMSLHRSDRASRSAGLGESDVSRKQADHPVVGICWYEAAAYACWVGKRLPTAAEWQKAGGWPDQLSGGGCNRYPWGNLF